MRSFTIAALVSIACMSLACARSGTAPATIPATRKAASLKPAATPGEALERSMQAMVEGDEAKYRQATLVKSPHGYSEAYVRQIFASARLHRAVREHNVTGRRVREAGFDRNYTLSPSIPPSPSAKESEATREAIRGIEWEMDGGVARPKGRPDMFSGGTQGKMSIERVDGGWVVVVADPTDRAPPEHLQQLAKGWSAQASVIDAATAQVKAGKLRTIREVNDLVDAKRKTGDDGE